MISKTSAVMVKDDDIKQLFLAPDTRYEGELAVEGQYLIFRGRDVKQGSKFEEVILLDEITEIFLAVDEWLKSSVGSSFGIGGSVPFIVRYQSPDGEQVACFNIYLHNSARFNTYLSDYHVGHRNLQWYEMLKDTVTMLQVSSPRETDKVNPGYAAAGVGQIFS